MDKAREARLVVWKRPSSSVMGTSLRSFTHPVHLHLDYMIAVRVVE